MLTTHLSFFILLFSYYSSPVLAVGPSVQWHSLIRNGDTLTCNTLNANPRLIGEVPESRNCLRAIEKIPGGVRPLDPDFLAHKGRPDPARPISLEIDKRTGGYRPPAIFHSGDCDVLVDVHNLHDHRPAVQVGSGFMFFDFWPLVKLAAQGLVDRCVAGLQVEGGVLRVLGTYEWNFAIDSHYFNGFIRIQYRSPGNWPRGPTGNVKVFDADKPGTPEAKQKRLRPGDSNPVAKQLKNA